MLFVCIPILKNIYFPPKNLIQAVHKDNMTYIPDSSFRFSKVGCTRWRGDISINNSFLLLYKGLPSHVGAGSRSLLSLADAVIHHGPLGGSRAARIGMGMRDWGRITKMNGDILEYVNGGYSGLYPGLVECTTLIGQMMCIIFV